MSGERMSDLRLTVCFVIVSVLSNNIQQMEWLKISTSTELIKVKTEDIAFVKADGNYSDLYLFNGKPHKVTFKLHVIDETFQKLKSNIFVRVGKSLIVNRNYIYVINITTQELLLSNSHLQVDFKLKASREALKELKNTIEEEGDKS